MAITQPKYFKKQYRLLLPLPEGLLQQKQFNEISAEKLFRINFHPSNFGQDFTRNN
jgi:hypothetical protein